MSTTNKLHDHIISLLNVFLKNKVQTFGKENIHDRPDITQLANTNIPLYNKSLLLQEANLPQCVLEGLDTSTVIEVRAREMGRDHNAPRYVEILWNFIGIDRVVRRHKTNNTFCVLSCQNSMLTKSKY